MTKTGHLFDISFGTLGAPKESHEAFFLADLAIRQLEKLNRGARPFTLRVDFWGPHQPYFPTEEFLALYDEESICLPVNFTDDLKNKPVCYESEYAAVISKGGKLIRPSALEKDVWKRLLKFAYAQNTLVDEAAGRIADYIEHSALKDDTLVIWSADHGDALASHGGHMDKSCYLTEEVLRIPLAVAGGGVQCGVSQEYVSNLDIPATILDYCGGKFDGKIYSESLLKEIGRKFFVSVTHGHFDRHTALSLRKGKYKFNENIGQIDELYDLENDPFEMDNLSEREKDIADEFRKMLAHWKAEVGFRTFE